jgi:hypothetical protein
MAVNPEDNASLLRRAADRARARQEFLGWVLARCEGIEGMAEESVRTQLGVSLPDWLRLQVCLRPRPEAFLQDVTQIAGAFNLDRAALAAVIRRVEAVESVRSRAQPGGAGSLLAARTRKQKPAPSKPEASSDEGMGT